jgi:hypothetical protein
VQAPLPTMLLLFCGFYNFFVIFLLFSLTFVGVLLFVFCGFGCFRSSATVPLRHLAVFSQQQLSLGGCCFCWLGLFELFCHFKPHCATPGQARLVYSSSELIDGHHYLLFLFVFVFYCLFR